MYFIYIPLHNCFQLVTISIQIHCAILRRFIDLSYILKNGHTYSLVTYLWGERSTAASGFDGF